MSNYMAKLECPSCGASHMLAINCSRIFGHHNPMVFQCNCGKLWRWTDQGPEYLVEYDSQELDALVERHYPVIMLVVMALDDKIDDLDASIDALSNTDMHDNIGNVSEMDINLQGAII